MTDRQYNNLPIYLDIKDSEYNSANEYIYNVTMPQAFSFMPDKEYEVIPNYFARYFNNSYFSIVTETKFGIPKSEDIHCNKIINDTNCLGTIYYNPLEEKYTCMDCDTQFKYPKCHSSNIFHS